MIEALTIEHGKTMHTLKREYKVNNVIGTLSQSKLESKLDSLLRIQKGRLSAMLSRAAKLKKEAEELGKRRFKTEATPRYEGYREFTCQNVHLGRKKRMLGKLIAGKESRSSIAPGQSKEFEMAPKESGTTPKGAACIRPALPSSSCSMPRSQFKRLINTVAGTEEKVEVSRIQLAALRGLIERQRRRGRHGEVVKSLSSRCREMSNSREV